MTTDLNQTTTETVIALPEASEFGAQPAAEEFNDSAVNWDDYSGEQGEGDAEEGNEVLAVEGELEVVAAPAATPEAPVAPTVTSAAPVVPVVPVVETPAPAPAVQAEQQPAPVAPVAPVAPAVPFDVAKWEAEQLTGLEKLYAISDEDANRLQTEPEVILPKLAANMHLSVTKAVMMAMQGMIPEALVQHQRTVTAEQDARTAFYSVNSDLDDPKYEAAVLQVASMFRAANPSAPRTVAIKTIGDMARMALGLSAPVAAPADTPVVPAQTPVRPFTPARGGGGGGNMPKAPNPWADMYSDD